MSHGEHIDKAAAFAKTAVEQMVGLGVPPTPGNFTIWYTHVSGANPALSRMISILIDNGQEFNDAICADMHKRFFASGIEEDSLHETAERISKEVGQILQFLGVAGEGAAKYGKTLESTSASLGPNIDPDALKKLVNNVLDETQKMESLNQKLEKRLSDSNSEVSRLREDLEDMRREALTDALTGIANRKLFDMELRRLAGDSMEAGEKLCLLLLDIDHFKKFNDTYGHQVGDEVLKLIAMTLAKMVKGSDVPARYGGEEFAVILPNTAILDAVKVAETIRKGVSTKKLVNRQSGTDLGKITVSIGVGQFEYGEPLPELIKRTDQALYGAKNKGRNCVMTEYDMEKEALSFN